MISMVYLLHTGMLMVFDKHGQQIPEYQDEEGGLGVGLSRVLSDAPAETIFVAIRRQTGEQVPVLRSTVETLAASLRQLDTLVEGIMHERAAADTREKHGR